MDLSSLVQAARSFLEHSLFSVGDFAFTVQRLLLFVAVLLGTWVVQHVLVRGARRVFTAQSEEEEGASGVIEGATRWAIWIGGIVVALDILGADVATARDVLNAEIFSISGTSISLTSVLVFAVIVAASWIVSRLIRQWAARGLRERSVDAGTIATTQRLIHYAVVALGLALALDNLGIDLAALFAAGAVFAVGIGFAMQNITQNFVSGLILLIERSIKPGDVVEVEGKVVSVQKMGIRATVARTRDEEEIVIPNSILVQNAVKNFTYQDSLYRLRAVVGVEYGSDMKQVMEVLKEAADAVDWRYKGKEPVVLLTEFASSSVNFDVSVWMNDPWTSPRGRSELMESLWFALKDAGITIAFPQLDVHFDGPVEEAITSFPKAS